jgi:hypothetical protein
MVVLRRSGSENMTRLSSHSAWLAWLKQHLISYGFETDAQNHLKHQTKLLKVAFLRPTRKVSKWQISSHS